MNRNGFAPIIILVVIAGVLVVGGGAYFYSQNKNNSAKNEVTLNATNPNPSVPQTEQSDNKVGIIITLTGPARLLVTDSGGHRSGMDLDSLYKEIPKVIQEINDADSPKPWKSRIEIPFSPDKESYIIDVLGVSSGTYELGIVAYNVRQEPVPYFASVLTSAGQKNEYHLQYQPIAIHVNDVSSLIDKQSELTLVSFQASFADKKFLLGQNTIDSVIFNIPPVYKLKPIYRDVDDGPDNDRAYYEKWSRWRNLKFVTHEYGIKIYRDNVLIDKIRPPWEAFSGGIDDVQMISYQSRDYFIFGGVSCGNGSCVDSYYLFSDAVGSSTKIVNAWGHGWGWGHGGTTPFGFQGKEFLSFAISYNEKLFLFPDGSSPIVVLDRDGNIIGKISERNVSLETILSESL